MPDLRRLHRRAVAAWRIAAGLRGALFSAAVLLADRLLGFPTPFGLAGGVVAGLAALNVLLLPPVRYRAWGFAVRSSDVYLRRGVVFRTTSIVPLARIQHVDTHHGPVDRALGLADLVIFTAGTRGAILTIPALGRDEAESLRDQLAELTGAGDAV